MTNAFNPLDPMNHSMYHEYEYPGTIEEVVKYYDSLPDPDGPKLRPQANKDSWCYSGDCTNEGKTSLIEKIKSFIKRHL